MMHMNGHCRKTHKELKMDKKALCALEKIRWVCIIFAASVFALSVVSITTHNIFFLRCASIVAFAGLAIITLSTSRIIHSQQD